MNESQSELHSQCLFGLIWRVLERWPSRATPRCPLQRLESIPRNARKRAFPRTTDSTIGGAALDREERIGLRG